MTGVRLSKRFAIAVEDIRHLQSRSHGTRSAGWHRLPSGADRAGSACCPPRSPRDGRECVPHTVTCLLKPAGAQPERQAACNTFGTSGRSSSRPGTAIALAE